MNLKVLLKNKRLTYTMLIAGVLALLYLLLRLLVFPADPILPLLTSIYNTYLLLPEWIANQLFHMKNAGVVIRDHTFVFDGNTEYQSARAIFFDNWYTFLMYKRWSLLVLVLIWGIVAPIKRKVYFTVLFILTHFLSVLSGLYLLGVSGPALYAAKPSFFLSPTHAGTLLMYILAAVWLRINIENIHATLKKLKLDFKLSGKKITEILVLFFFLIIIRSFLLDFFPFRNYVHFLLVSTQFFSSLFNYEGYISGDQLIGPTGALAVSKHCLGFLTMYIFAAMVYLTRTKNPKTNWIFILSGLAFLVVLNIVRLVLLFIVVQGPDGVNTAMDHHDIYNYIIFAIVFVMWIVWWEVFLGKEKKGKG